MDQTKACAIAVDFGGTSIKMGVTRYTEILAEAPPIPTQSFSSPEGIVEAMVSTALELRKQFPDVVVTGLGLPGWCDYRAKRLYNLTNVDVWDHEVPLAEIMEREVGLPVVLDNDANCMAYAEWKLGAGKGLHNIVCLTLGTGIGGGVIIHDRMVRGRRLSAGELGQTSIDYKGRRGTFGNTGAIEEYIGNRELAAEALKRYAEAGVAKSLEECNPKALEDEARSGCPIAVQLWNDMAHMLATLLMNQMFALAPEAFIIGGGVAKAGDLLWRPLRTILKEQLFPMLYEDLQILPARFGSNSGLIGAGAMSLDEWIGLGELPEFKRNE